MESGCIRLSGNRKWRASAVAVVTRGWLTRLSVRGGGDNLILYVQAMWIQIAVDDQKWRCFWMKLRVSHSRNNGNLLSGVYYRNTTIRRLQSIPSLKKLKKPCVCLLCRVPICMGRQKLPTSAFSASLSVSVLCLWSLYFPKSSSLVVSKRCEGDNMYAWYFEVLNVYF